MTRKEFWQQVFLSYASRGWTAAEAASQADEAIARMAK